MSSVGQENLRPEPYHGGDWRPEHRPHTLQRPGVSLGLLIPGLALVGLGALAWYYLGPDLRRYMKIKSM